MTQTDRVRILKDDDNCPDLPIVDGGGRAWAVVWPGVGARLRSLHHMVLDPRSRTIGLSHPMEAVYYVMDGSATVVDASDGSSQDLRQGSMAYIEPGTRYVFEAGQNGAGILGGPCPPDPSMYTQIEGLDTDPVPFPSSTARDQGVSGREQNGAQCIRVFHIDEPSAMVPMIANDARLIVWPGVGVENANMNYVNMQPGERNVDHVHEESEDTIYVLEGKGSIQDLTNDVRLEFEAGEVVHVPVGIWHAVSGDRGEPVVSVGGPCPADWNMLRAAGLVPDESVKSGE